MAEPTTPRARVLVIDDDEFVCTTFQRILGSAGYETTSASGGKEGLRVLSRQPAEVLLLDLKLPDMPGLEVLKRAINLSPATAVIVITGYASVDSAVGAMRLGAYDYVAKPCRAKELLLRVGHGLEKVRLEQALSRTRTIFRALNQAALSLQNARSLDQAFRCIGEQMRSIGMTCAIYQRLESSPEHLALRYVSLSDGQIAQLQGLLGCQIPDLRVRYLDWTFLRETLSYGIARWHPLEDRFLGALFACDNKRTLDSVRNVLGGETFVHVPLRLEGKITGTLVAVGGDLSDRDVSAMVAFAHEVSIALDTVHWMEQISQSERELKELSARLMTIQEEERRRISGDLHDSIGQALSAIKLDLELLAKGLNRVDASLASRLRESIGFLSMTMKELRTVSADLRPPILDDLGLVPTLRWYTGMYAGQDARLTFSEDLDGELNLCSKAEIAIFRIVQEALSNATHHAHASHISVQVKQADRAIHIVVEDDGVGFEVHDKKHGLCEGRGLGLVSMRERARLLNAELTIESKPGQGTKAFLAVPLEEKEVQIAQDQSAAG